MIVLKIFILEYGISMEDILRDLWVFKYSIQNIQKRLRFAKENNIEKFKTWMIRVPPIVLEK